VDLSEVIEREGVYEYLEYLQDSGNLRMIDYNNLTKKGKSAKMTIQQLEQQLL
jgi:hypothetical protein